MKTKYVKIVLTIPADQADMMRSVMADLGLGKIGHYDFCSFSSQGIGRFRPLQDAKPAIGSLNKIEKVIEERIEVVCPRKILKKSIEAIKKVHPYEEPAIDIYSLEEF